MKLSKFSMKKDKLILLQNEYSRICELLNIMDDKDKINHIQDTEYHNKVLDIESKWRWNRDNGTIDSKKIKSLYFFLGESYQATSNFKLSGRTLKDSKKALESISDFLNIELIYSYKTIDNHISFYLDKIDKMYERKINSFLLIDSLKEEIQKNGFVINQKKYFYELYDSETKLLLKIYKRSTWNNG